MVLILRWEFSILEPNVRVFCIHIVLLLQTISSDIATAIYQYCDGLFDEKFWFDRLDARIAELFNTYHGTRSAQMALYKCLYFFFHEQHIC